MDSPSFVRELDGKIAQLLSGLDHFELVEAESENRMEMAHLLKIALKNEIEASEIAALWMNTTKEIDVKLGLARQAGDEARHYGLIEQRLRQMGVDLSGFQPLADGYSKMFQYLKSLEGTVERLAAGQFTRERIALKRNTQFIRFCEMHGDMETAGIYREIIQPEERFHHELGRQMLLKYATDEAAQESARNSVERTLQIAEELRGLAERRLGISQIPGC